LSPITRETFSRSFPELASSLSSEDLEVLLTTLEVRDADAGEALVAEGTSSDDLFLVLDGRLDITMRRAGGERPLAQLGPGSYFGEVSLLDPGPARASVVAEQGCIALQLSRDRLDDLRASHPAAAAALLHEVVRSLAARVRAAAEQAAVSPAGRR
jgi:CRP/FNR family cyclic AMP-dependent transcriptional regulator